MGIDFMKFFVLVLMSLVAQLSSAKVDCASFENGAKKLQDKLSHLLDEQDMLELKIEDSDLSFNRAPSAIEKRNTLKTKLGELRRLERDLLEKLDLSQEKILMCKTHNIKYPTVLIVAQGVGKYGCADYTLKDYKDGFKMDAQMEAYDALCSKK